MRRRKENNLFLAAAHALAQSESMEPACVCVCVGTKARRARRGPAAAPLRRCVRDGSALRALEAEGPLRARWPCRRPMAPCGLVVMDIRFECGLVVIDVRFECGLVVMASEADRDRYSHGRNGAEEVEGEGATEWNDDGESNRRRSAPSDWVGEFWPWVSAVH